MILVNRVIQGSSVKFKNYVICILHCVFTPRVKFSFITIYLSFFSLIQLLSLPFLLVTTKQLSESMRLCLFVMFICGEYNCLFKTKNLRVESESCVSKCIFLKIRRQVPYFRSRPRYLALKNGGRGPIEMSRNALLGTEDHKNSESLAGCMLVFPTV